MPSLLPLQLVCAWALLFGFLLAHGYHEKRMRAFLSPAPNALFRAVEISNLLGLLSMAGILIYFFIQSTWYWTITLGLGGSVAGAFLAGLCFTLIGEERLSKCAFVGLPLAALWAVSIIHNIAS